MIKNVKDWNHTERQAYAKGVLEGVCYGFLLTVLIANLGLLLYWKLQ